MSQVDQLAPNEELLRIPTPTPDSSRYLSAIIRHPLSLDDDSPGLYPATHRLGILMHGIGSSKEYSLLRRLSQGLSDKLGMWSVRFDFRNCGFSSLNGKEGRTVEEDVQDVEAVYQFLQTGQYKGIKFVVDVLAGHSRGVVDMFEWGLAHPEHYVPQMVAISGRYIGQGLIDKTRSNFPDFEKEGGHWEPAMIKGERKTVWVPANETFDLGGVNMGKVARLNPNTETFVIYGTKEATVSLPSAGMFANSLSPRCTSQLIEGGDHCYYGTEKIAAEQAQAQGLLYSTRRGVADYNQQAADAILEYLSQGSSKRRFYESHQLVHRFLPRWKDVDGVVNFRDIGGYPAGDRHVRYNHAYRCADTSMITKAGLSTLQELGIKAVFDLRSSSERDRGKVVADGIENLHVPLFGEQSLAPEDELKHFNKLFSDWFAYFDLYKEILHVSPPQLHKIFTWIKDHPHDNFLFHCTAGKDRTGVLGMLLLRLCGVPEPIVAREFEQTEIGIRPLRERIENMKLTKEPMSEEGLDNLLSARYETMLETIRYIDLEYGGVEQYLLDQVDLSQEDVSKIKESLLVK